MYNNYLGNDEGRVERRKQKFKREIHSALFSFFLNKMSIHIATLYCVAAKLKQEIK